MSSNELISATTIDEILAERQRQDEQWGGSIHDDNHAAYEWFDYIDKQWGLGRGASRKISTLSEARARLVKIAALAMAGIESMDRRYFSKDKTDDQRVD